MARSIIRRVLVDGQFTSGAAVPDQKTAPKPAPKPEQPDSYQERIIKYVPAEVIVLYTTLRQIISLKAPDNVNLMWIPFVICLLGVYVYLYRTQNNEIKSHKKIDPVNWWDINISAFSFVLWAASLGSPFTSIPTFDKWGPLTVALALPTFTFLAPRIKE